ncbi:hypothetical protein PMAYCL1PPCAC_10248 [Pristionchus mayeri]|uniref:NR LBD domain-containing protein n=1 Tax=Pristionchus mayeri TaxID=1317129 RepID=A0AAN5C783_9BILA|nr:hypothetical protein PMAYCL1PPCAC_10248 [Pristionchus mayeri]
MMCSAVTCFDMERAYLREEPDDTENGASLIRFTKAHADDQGEIFLPIFNKCLLEDREYYALMALVATEIGELFRKINYKICSDSSCDISEHAQSILDEYRKEVLDDLQSYYRNELRLKDFSTRLGNLMTLSHTVQECKLHFKVFFRFFATMFDVYLTDNAMKNFFL